MPPQPPHGPRSPCLGRAPPLKHVSILTGRGLELKKEMAERTRGAADRKGPHGPRALFRTFPASHRTAVLSSAAP